MDILIYDADGCRAEPFVLWDSVWDPNAGEADWAMAGPDEGRNIGGLQAKQALATAVVIALFSDRRLPDDLAGADPTADRRGWWGDEIDVRPELGEEPIGSLLWTLERSTLDAVRVPGRAEAYAKQALQTLIRQGVVARVDASATAMVADGRLDLEVDLYSRDGSKAYSQKFGLVWRQVQAMPAPPRLDGIPARGFGPSLDFSDPENSQLLPLI